MRISDWSSDVCSSDLTHLGQAGGALRPALLRQYVNRAAERVARLQLRPDYLERVYRDRATAFDRVSRLFTSVNPDLPLQRGRSEEHTSELQSLMRITYAVFCLKKKILRWNRCQSQRHKRQ